MEKITTIAPQSMVRNLLIKLCHTSTWEGVNKYNARDIFDAYTKKIDNIYKGLS